MLIGKDWKIESDALNVTLSRKRTRKSKDGNSFEEWEVEGYYSSVPNALKGMVNQGIRETGLRDMRVIVTEIEKLNQKIDKVLPIKH